MLRRVAGVMGVVAGLTLVVGTFAVGGFRAAAAGERLLNLSRPELTKEGTVALRRDFNNVNATGVEIATVIIPAYAQAEGVRVDQLPGLLAVRYPALAKEAAEAPSTAVFTEKAISNIEAHQHDFAPADDIPTSFLPLTVAPAITLGLGIVLIVSGLFALRRSSGRGPLIAMLVTGIVILAFTFGGGTFHKVSATHDLISSLNITKASADETRSRLDTATAGGQELASKLLPDLQAKMGMSNQQFDAFLTARAPHLAVIRSDVGRAISRFEIDARIREQGFRDFGIIKDVPIRALPWLYVVSGVLAVLGGGVALIAYRRDAVDLESQATPEVAMLA
jgi:hypothetical protein